MSPSSAGSSGDVLVALAQINRGRAAEAATKKLAEVVKAVTEIGGKGSVTIKITVAPFGGSDTGNVDVQATVTSSVPQPSHGAVFFFDENFSLTRDDPSMDALFDRDDEHADGGER